MAVVEGGLPDVEPTHADDVAATADQPGDQTQGRRTLRRQKRQPASGRPRRRTTGLMKPLLRLWIPLVILAVIVGGGFAVSKLRGVFGSDQRIPYTDTKTDNNTPINPKYMRYEIFGPPGTVATISYFGADGSPEKLDGVPLPWSVEFPITTAASVGSIAAQGDSDTIGCRILVGGEVKAEKIVNHEVSSFTSCLLKAA